MNPFFHISEDHNLSDEALPLKNLGPQQAWLTVGRRGSNFWGTSDSPSKTTYRDTTAEDYDQQFIRKLMRWKPIYQIHQVLEHHYLHYLKQGQHPQADFLKHLRYVILPTLRKKPNAEVCSQLFEEWLNDKENRKPVVENILKTASINKTVHRIHFDDLSWSDFERLIFAFVKRLRTWKTIDWLGQGGRDDGQDIWGECLGKTYCYLCANYQVLTNRKANKDIDKLVKNNAIPDYLIVVCGGKVSAGVNKSIKTYAQNKGINNVEIWSGADIEESIRLQAPDLLKRFFEGNSFPEMTNSFTSPSINKLWTKKTDLYDKVFISYAKEDYRYAVELYDYLKHHGYEPWLDKKCLLPGSNWEFEINRALKESDFIIPLLSSTSVSKRGYVQKEYKLAMQYWEQRLEDDIYIIPVLINECKVPESLRRFQWVRYADSTFTFILQALNAQRKILIEQANFVENFNNEGEGAENQESGSDLKRYATKTQMSKKSITESQLMVSRRIHDEVANGLYQVMTEVENKGIDKYQLLDKLESVYIRSRDISYEGSLNTSFFYQRITKLLSSFATENTKVILTGNDEAFWAKIGNNAKQELEAILYELMVNMKKHSRATNVVIRFAQKKKQIYIDYLDDGIGLSENYRTGNGFRNTVKRLKAINGTIDFSSSGNKGLLAHISIPIANL